MSIASAPRIWPFEHQASNETRVRPGCQPHLLGVALLMALLAAGYIHEHGFFGGFSTAQAFTRILPGWLWESLTALGDERMLLALTLPLCLRYPKLLWAIVLAAVLGGLMSRGIKVLAYLPRPPAVLSPDQITVIGHKLMGKSFPSGHTVSVFSFVGVWIAIRGRRYALLMLLAAAVVGLSRVAVGAHWPADTLVGATVGLVSAWGGLRIAQSWDWGTRNAVHQCLVWLVVIAVLTLPFDGQGYPESLFVRVLFCCWGLSLAFIALLSRRPSGELRLSPLWS